MCGSAPKPPAPMDPYAEAQTQQGLNLTSMEEQQLAQQPNQYNPYGSQTWTQTGTGPNGQPIYSMSQNLSPTEQGLLGQYQGFQGAAGGAGANLMGAAANMYGAGIPNFTQGANNLTNEMMGHEVSYLSPFFNQQNEQLNTRLANQGITPNSPAYQQAMNNQLQGQDQAVSGFLAQAEPQAFSQAVQQYELPFQMASQLAQAGGPAGLSFSNTPSYNMQPANYIGAVGQQQQMEEQQYQAQLQQQNAMMQGIAGLGQAGILGSMMPGAMGAGSGSLMGMGLGAMMI